MMVAWSEVWMVTALANVVMVGVYSAISIMMVRALKDGRQWFTNPLLLATAMIFVTCSLGHGFHLFHATIGFYAVDPVVGAAARVAMTDWRLVAWDVTTAGVAIWYWTLRHRFAIIYGGAALCEDMERRQLEALELHDNVVQGLARAKLAFDMERADEGASAVNDALDASKRIVVGLLGEGSPTSPLQVVPGDLRRDKGGV